MNRIRVCTINPDFYRSSGVTHAIERLQRSSSNLAIDWVNIACTESDGASNDDIDIAGVFRLMDSSFCLISDIFRFRTFLKNQKIDVLHVHHRRLALVAGFIAKSLKIPVVYTGHLVYGSGMLLKLAPIDAAIAITNDVLIDFKIHGRAKSTFVISNQAKFYNAPPPQPPESKRVTICCIGRLEPVKNHATLLRAWAQSKSKCYSKLILVGEGSLREQLEKMVESLGICDSVDFAGYTDSVDTFIRDAHFLVLPSLIEGQGIVILEAAGLYRPTLVSDVPGARDCLPPNLALPNRITSNDIQGFADALDAWSANLFLVEQDGQKFNNYLKTIASPEVVANKTHDVYRHVMMV